MPMVVANPNPNPNSNPNPNLNLNPGPQQLTSQYAHRGVYMLLARRLTSSNAPGQDRQRLRALKLASREFNLSLSHYTPQPTPTYIQVCAISTHRTFYSPPHPPPAVAICQGAARRIPRLR